MGIESEMKAVGSLQGKGGEFLVEKVDEAEPEYEKYLTTPPRSLRHFCYLPKQAGGSSPPNATHIRHRSG